MYVYCYDNYMYVNESCEIIFKCAWCTYKYIKYNSANKTELIVFISYDFELCNLLSVIFAH